MNNDTDINNFDDEIDFAQLLKIFILNKSKIIKITFIAAFFSVAFALLLPNVYKSTALLSPTSQEDSMSSKLGGLSGLAGLAGVNLPTGATTKTQIAIKRIESFEFFKKYFLPNVKKEDLVAAKKWNASDNTIQYKKRLFEDNLKKWKKYEPSDQEAFKDYREILSITEEEETGLVYLSIEHKSPVIAKDWVEIVIYSINESMRTVDKEDAQNSVNFLSESTKAVSIQSIKEVTAKLLESQMQTLMLASSNKEYVFKIIDSPYVPEKKSGPYRSVIVIIGTLLGLFISLITVLTRHFSDNPKS